jgi:UDP-N-acetylglucosamine 2-epimerase
VDLFAGHSVPDCISPFHGSFDKNAWGWMSESTLAPNEYNRENLSKEKKRFGFPESLFLSSNCVYASFRDRKDVGRKVHNQHGNITIEWNIYDAVAGQDATVDLYE